MAAELGYNKDTMYAELLEIAEVRLKDAKEAGLISQEQMEKKFAYFSEIALKWVHKIFADTYEEEIKKFEGTIKAIDGHLWKVSVEDELWIVDVSEASIRVDPRVELRVAVAGIVKDNYILALEIDEAEEQH